MAARVVALVEHPAPEGGERGSRRARPGEPLPLGLEADAGDR
jgi:hypothetical protein